MKEIVVHVTTLEQWKSVLDIWFEHGYSWYSGDKEYHGGYFKDGIRELLLNKDNDILIPTPEKREPISYKEFMSQQKKEGNNMRTYYVTRDQYDLIEELYGGSYPLDELLNRHVEAKKLFGDFAMEEGSAVLRYLGDDASIELLVKDPLYRLSRIDAQGDKVYMKFSYGTPDWTMDPERALTAPLEEIEKHKNSYWDTEEAK